MPSSTPVRQVVRHHERPPSARSLPNPHKGRLLPVCCLRWVARVVGDAPSGSAVRTCFTGLGPALRAATRRSPGIGLSLPTGSARAIMSIAPWVALGPRVPALVRLCCVREAVISWLAGWALEVVEVRYDPGSPLQPRPLGNS